VIDRDGCLTPFAQALAVGLLTGGTVMGFVLWLAYEDARWLGLTVFAGSALWWYTGSIQIHRRATYSEYQQVAPTPVQQDVKHVTTIPVYLNEREAVFPTLSASEQQLKELAIGLLNGVPFAEDSWTPEYKLFSKAQFREVRDEFLNRKLAEWKSSSHAQGVRLTHSGVGLCRKLAGE
jgi:hypothetical protein